MSFLDIPPPERERYQPPPWLGPPVVQIGVPVSVRTTLLEGVDETVALVGATLYPCGAMLSIATLWRTSDREAEGYERQGFMHHDGGLRFGIELADGRTATSLDPWPGDEIEPAKPTLHWGSAPSFAFGASLWLWPLRAETFVLHAAWPMYDLRGRSEIDASTWPQQARGVLEPLGVT